MIIVNIIRFKSVNKKSNIDTVIIFIIIIIIIIIPNLYNTFIICIYVQKCFRHLYA